MQNLPVIFSKVLKEEYQKALVYVDMGNRDYEGEVIGGGSVKITQFNDVSIVNYDPAVGLSAAEQVGNTQLTLTIDQFKAFNVRVDSVEKVQRNLPMLQRHMANAAKQIAKAHDTFFSSKYTEADANNLLGTDAAPVAISTPEEAYDNLVELARILDDADVPEADRSVAVSPAFEALLKKDARFTKSDSVLLNGVVGEAAGFTIKKTTLAPVVNNGTADVVKIIAMHKSAITFADQLEELAQYNPENFFGDAIKGLSVYGAKTVNAKGIAVLTITK